MAEGGMPVPGAVLDGKYRLVRQLGAGGMGIVYEADHIRLRQPFAIKILQPELAQEREFLMRFEREARAAALLRSPHVVRVFDVDVSPEGLTYMVMELLEGRDLSEEATAGVPPVPQLVDWVIQACSGLQEAHDNGIVHRDLKPANIFLAKVESGERIAKVLDFGISKIDATSTSHLTDRKQGALGTPTYMAPEQIRNRTVDGRADLWALGVMLYRVLGGRWPFSGKGDQGYMAAVLADPALPFEMVRPDLPYELANVIMKSLEKELSRRHQSATELAAALVPFGSGRAPLVSRTSLPAASTASAPPAAPTPPHGPMAIIMLPSSGAQTLVDQAGAADTVVDGRSERPPPARVESGPQHAVLSPPATAFAPSTTTRAPSGGPTAVIIAACCALAIGFGAYMIATARKTSGKTTTSASASIGGASGESVGAGAEPLPPAAIDLPGASSVDPGKPSSTGVPSDPSAAASHHKKPLRPPSGSPSASASSGSATSPPATASAPAIPDHL